MVPVKPTPNKDRLPQIRIETKFSKSIREAIESIEASNRPSRIKYRFRDDWIEIFKK
jgi:hypothetical protein